MTHFESSPLPDLLSVTRLILCQEGLGESAFTGEFERSEVLAPRAIGNLRVTGDPAHQAGQVMRGKIPRSDAIFEMGPHRRRQPSPVDVRHGSGGKLYTEDGLFDFFPAVRGVGVAWFRLKLLYHAFQLSFTRFDDSLDKGVYRFEHGRHLLTPLGFHRLGHLSASKGLDGFSNTVEGDGHGPVFPKVAHLQRLLAKAFQHAPDFRGRKSDFSLCQFFKQQCGHIRLVESG